MEKRYKAVVNPKPTTVILLGNDSRFTPAIEEFIAHKLKLTHEDFIQITLEGGPAALANQEKKLMDFYHIRCQVVSAVRRAESVKKVVVFGHQDCRYYENMANNHPDCEDREKKDLPKAAHVIYKLVGPLDVQVEAYYARFADTTHTEIIFEKIEDHAPHK